MAIFIEKREFDTWVLGYVFNKDHHGKGYATEAAKALLVDLFANGGAHRVIAMCNTLNTASWKLLERLGMCREGHLHKNVWFSKDENGNPKWQDNYEYAILKENFQ